MQRLTSIAVLLVLAACALASPADPVPRKSPEFAISEPSGKTTLLSSFKGKVVVMEFLFIKSAHCARVAQTINRLQKELGPRGFQSIAIAFPAPGSDANGPMVTDFVQSFSLTYPVGYTNKQSVDSYFGRTGNQMLSIPQVVVIDRAGVIRAQSGPQYNSNLEDHDPLRNLLETLLKESPSVDGSQKPAPASKGQR
jgi:peroxiredoxin